MWQATNKIHLINYILNTAPEWFKGFGLLYMGRMQTTIFILIIYSCRSKPVNQYILENVSIVFVHTMKVNGVQNIIDFEPKKKKIKALLVISFFFFFRWTIPLTYSTKHYSLSISHHNRWDVSVTLQSLWRMMSVLHPKDVLTCSVSSFSLLCSHSSSPLRGFTALFWNRHHFSVLLMCIKHKALALKKRKDERM